MKSYYQEDQRYTPEALALDDRVQDLLGPIIREEIAKGYPSREVSQIISSAICHMDCLAVLTQGKMMFSPSDEKKGSGSDGKTNTPNRGGT